MFDITIYVFSALKNYCNIEVLSENYAALRSRCNTGKIVYDFIQDVTILIRDCFRKSTDSRLERLMGDRDAIENDPCWNHNGEIQNNAYVLQFCKRCINRNCPFNVQFVQFQLR